MSEDDGPDYEEDESDKEDKDLESGSAGRSGCNVFLLTIAVVTIGVGCCLLVAFIAVAMRL